MKTKLIVLENDSWSWKGFEKFIVKINKNFKTFCPEVSDHWYFNNTALHLSMTLCQKDVTDVAMMSAFETSTSVSVIKDKKSFELSTQIEVLMPVIREILRFREIQKFPKLTFHIVYNGIDFIKDMKKGDLGETTWSSFELFMRQQDNIIVKIYNNETFELKETYLAPHDF